MAEISSLWTLEAEVNGLGEGLEVTAGIVLTSQG